MNSYTDKDMNILNFIAILGWSMSLLSMILLGMVVGPSLSKLENRLNQVEKVDDI